MNFFLPFTPSPLPVPIRYTDKILLIGSCFTEHIAGRLSAHKFKTLQSPHGILFNPLSIASSLKSYVEEKLYSPEDLFQLNELWNSWDHHSRYSHIDKDSAISIINASQQRAAAFIKDADWIMLTLGSAFQYFLKDGNCPVANNHRAPAAWFEKKLLTIEEITSGLSAVINSVQQINPAVKILFTISPVRHIRDGVVDNNRSKARLIEAVHNLIATNPACHYFPSYEIVIDILRDYRFYDVDMVHPNYPATETVWEYFTQSCLSPDALPVMEQVKDIMTARSHRPRFPETAGHQKFLHSYAQKTKNLMTQFPFLNLSEELQYFSAVDSNIS